MTTTHPHLLVKDEGPIRTITLNRPDARNAQLPSLWLSLAELARTVPETSRIVIIDAAGASFSAGLDRAMLSPQGAPGEPNLLILAAEQGQDAVCEAIEGFQQAFDGWRQCPAVVIAAVQGHAIGAGFQLALAADLRVVSDDVQFAMRETSLGLVPDLGGTRSLVELIGYGRALEICATGRTVGAAEAVSLGLAAIAVPRDDLGSAVRDLAGAILDAPEHAMRALKPLLAQATSGTAADQLRRERHTQAGILVSLARGLRP